MLTNSVFSTVFFIFILFLIFILKGLFYFLMLPDVPK